MRLQQITARTYVLPFQERGDRPNLGYVNGDHFSAIIDTGNSPAHLALLLNEIARLRMRRPKFAVLTHWHWDHTFGMCAFPGVTIANSKTQKQLEKMKLWQWHEDAVQKRLHSGEEIAFCDENMRVEYARLNEIRVVQAGLVFSKELTLDLGGVSLIVKMVVSPHTDDSSLILVPEEGVLFVGDADSGDFYGREGGYDVGKTSAYLDLVRSLPFNRYIHGHAEVLTKAQSLATLEGILQG